MRAGQSNSFARSTNEVKQFWFWKTQRYHFLNVFHYIMNKFTVQRFCVMTNVSPSTQHHCCYSFTDVLKLHHNVAFPSAWHCKCFGKLSSSWDKWPWKRRDGKTAICQQCEERNTWEQINEFPQENSYGGYEGTDLSIQTEETLALQKLCLFLHT